jgi:hypothetical protein
LATGEEIQRELDTFYRQYIEVFNRADLDRIADSFAYPYGTISGERGLAPVASRDENRAAFGRLMPALKQRGWARTGIDRIKAWALGEELGMILTDVTRYGADDSVLEKLRACYMVRRDGGSWKIVTISEVKPSFLGPGDIPR